MSRLKGWAHRYNAMRSEQIRIEIRRIGRSTYIYDREAKLAFLASLK